MNIHRLAIPDVLLIEPKIFGDDRGFFLETFRRSWLEDQGIDVRFVQDNMSRSKKNTLRGLHYQLTNPQAKLVMVSRGAVLDVAVDIRRGSPTFGKYVSAELSEENKKLMYIPAGFAHGFKVLTETADFQYKCSTYYDPTSEKAVLWSDPDINVNWEAENPILSEKDKNARPLRDFSEDELPVYNSK